MILAKEGTGWDMEATAIVKGTKNLDAARALADWASTAKAAALYTQYYAVAAVTGVANYPANYPTDAESAMIKKNDFTWAASHRDAILAEWSTRYNAKSEPK